MKEVITLTEKAPRFPAQVSIGLKPNEVLIIYKLVFKNGALTISFANSSGQTTDTSFTQHSYIELPLCIGTEQNGFSSAAFGLRLDGKKEDDYSVELVYDKIEVSKAPTDVVWVKVP